MINLFNLSYNIDQLFSNKAILFEVIYTIINPSTSFATYAIIINVIDNYSSSSNFEGNFCKLLSFNNGISPLIITLIATTILHFCLLLIVDKIYSKRKFQKGKYKINVNKKNGIFNDYKNYSIYVHDLNKEYDIKLSKKEREVINKRNDYHYDRIHKSKYNKCKYVKSAIDKISFSVKKNEIFGIVGFKGSGKNTILNIITSSLPQTSGKVFYDGIELNSSTVNKIFYNYCPQKEFFWEHISLHENIKYTLKLCGYSSNEVEKYITEFIEYFKLGKKEYGIPYRLNNDTKRILCFILSICNGNCNKIILNEPTLNMNSSSKKKTWKAIKELKERNEKSIIISTCSIKEAQALCDRIGILVNGRFVCVGTPEDIKGKYCKKHYILIVYSKNLKTFQKKIIEEENLLGQQYTKEDEYNKWIKYKAYIPCDIGRVFAQLEKCKSSKLISFYSFSELTLEQYYIDLMK